jgi:hypothetical protein
MVRQAVHDGGIEVHIMWDYPKFIYCPLGQYPYIQILPKEAPVSVDIETVEAEFLQYRRAQWACPEKISVGFS